MKFTIFTPTYNRAYKLPDLYKSLVNQSYKDFEWVIVDDGSSDNTEEQVTSFTSENKINIIYLKQDNGGKHRAVNTGLKYANGELFFIVDSDDTLTSNSLERILFYYNQIENDSEFAGVVGVMSDNRGKLIGNGMKYEVIDSNLIERRYKHNIQGDLAKVIRTTVFRDFLFPDISGENFVAESIVWNRMAQKYKFRYFNEVIYIGEYLEGGLSNNSIRNRRKNPTYACIIYSELANNPLISLKFKIRAMINYWRFAFCKKNSFIEKVREVRNFPLNLLVMPIGYLYYIKDFFKNTVKINN